MSRLTKLALMLAPLSLTAAIPAAVAQTATVSPIAQVSAHLQAVSTMTAGFTQTDRKGQTLTGTLTMKRPGKIRFQYQKGVPLLIVGDGKALTMIDYEVKQVSRWPIGKSPLAVLLNPQKDISRIAKVVRNDAQVVLVEARDPKRPEFGTLAMAFAKIPSAPGGLMLQGWTTTDAQNNRSTVRLSNQQFNMAIADSRFLWTDPRRRGPRG